MTFLDIFNSWITFMLLLGVGFALLFFTDVKSIKKEKEKSKR